MTSERKELFSEKVLADGRTYFFDVKESQEGSKYLVISESRQVGSGYEHNRVMVFEENLEAFFTSLAKAAEFLKIKNNGQLHPANAKHDKLLPKETADQPKAYSVEEVHQEYPRAYEKWLPDEDEALKRKFSSGNSLVELADLFERKPGAIRSRLIKLGLINE